MTPQDIRTFVPQMKSNLDLLTLLNKVKHDIYGDDCHDFSLKLVTYYCNPRRVKGAYKIFKIPKKSGGVRIISAPKKSLKRIQECLNVVFQALYTPSQIATGFLPGKSVVDNAAKHVGMNYVFNTDIKDFFPSIDQARVWKMLQLERYGFSKEMANIVAGLCCMKVVTKDPDTQEVITRYVLPQGSPASPILTNMVCENLDRRLLGIAKRFNLNCSRYADDITFSSSHNVYAKDGEFFAELKKVIESQNFRMNEPKTRLQRRNQRQEVTGLVVSDRINVTRQYTRDIQSILYIWKRYGYDTAFAKFMTHYVKNKPNNPIGHTDFMENVIKGKLMYLKMVKGENNPVYLRLTALFESLCPPKSSKRMEMGEYVLVYTIGKFESQYETTVTFNSVKKDDKERIYAQSRILGKNVCIAVSRKSQDAIKSLLESSGEEDGMAKIKKRLYIVFVTHEDGKSHWIIMNANPRFAKSQETEEPTPPSAGSVQEPTIDNAGDASPAEEKQSIDAVLTSFIDSGYDLNILEQWDKTNNS